MRLATLIAGLACLGAIPSALAAQEPTKTDAAYFNEYHAAPKDTVTNEVYQGWKQFALNCARCHGDFGVGTTFAPALIESVKPEGTIPSQELFITTVCAGRPDKGMPAWCAVGLEIGAIQNIYAYLIERSSGRMGLGRPAVRDR
ncbi:MAG TPA: cytochrome c [Gemmatimonadales bacterium]|nr:cytochrome c [Gemmatimonadales bacterium]